MSTDTMTAHVSPLPGDSRPRAEVARQQRAFKVIAGALFILASLLLSVAFLLLRKRFGYPEVIRKGPETILPRLHEMSNLVPYLFYAGVGGAGLCVFFASPLLAKIFAHTGDGLWAHLAKYCGMTAGFCFYAGILRWTFLFPQLAKFRSEGTYDPKAIDLVFEAFHTYVGETLAEHVGFTFMTFWLLFLSLAVLKTRLLNRWIGYAGLLLAGVIAYGNLEFFRLPGAFWANRKGVDAAGIWFLAFGINLLVTMGRDKPTAGVGVPTETR
jgi:hypothetical protein